MSKPIERPIILTAQEVNAVLAGDKTQHRIIIENTKDTQCLFSRDWRYDGRDFLDDDGCTPDPKGAHYVERLEPSEGEENQYTEDYHCIGQCPFGAIGDRLWVREQHYRHPDQRYWLTTKPHYFADGHLTLNDRHDAGLLQEYCAVDTPRWASRLLLEITDIRIERVTDITHNDSVAEYCFNFGEKRQQSIPPLTGFAEYWIEKHGNNAWRSNPWIWVIEFKVIKEGLL